MFCFYLFGHSQPYISVFYSYYFKAMMDYEYEQQILAMVKALEPELKAGENMVQVKWSFGKIVKMTKHVEVEDTASNEPVLFEKD